MYISGGNGHATLSLPRRVIIYVDTRGVASCPDLVYLLIMDTLCLGCISVVGLRVNPIRSGPIRSVLGRVESPDTDNSSDRPPKCVHTAYVGPCSWREGELTKICMVGSQSTALRRAEAGTNRDEY